MCRTASSRARRLGAVVHKKTATALALTAIKNEDKMEFSKLVEAIKGSYNDRFAEANRKWAAASGCQVPGEDGEEDRDHQRRAQGARSYVMLFEVWCLTTITREKSFG